MLLIDVDIGHWAKLGNVTNHPEDENVHVIECTRDQGSKLVVHAHDLCALAIGGQVYSQGHQFFPHYRVREVDDQLVDQGNAGSIRKCVLDLIVRTEMIHDSQQDGPVLRHFQQLHDLGNHTNG